MKTDLELAMTSGVFVEFRDVEGHTLGRAVHVDWRDRPLPATGDLIVSQVHSNAAPVLRKLSGVVKSRQFDVQTDLEGETSVWVYIVAEVTPEGARGESRRPPRGEFSPN